MTATTAIPIMTAIFPFAVGPFALAGRPKLWQNAAPTIRPSTVMALSELPSPERTSWRKGHPPNSTQPNPVRYIPSPYQYGGNWLTNKSKLHVPDGDS